MRDRDAIGLLMQLIVIVAIVVVFVILIRVLAGAI